MSIEHPTIDFPKPTIQVFTVSRLSAVLWVNGIKNDGELLSFDFDLPEILFVRCLQTKSQLRHILKICAATKQIRGLLFHSMLPAFTDLEQKGYPRVTERKLVDGSSKILIIFRDELGKKRWQ